MKYFSFTLLFILILQFSYGHIEPPKTLQEKLEADEQRQRIAQANIHAASLYSIDENNEQTCMVNWVYDSLGRETNMTLFSKEGLPESWITQTYDQYGNLVLDVDCDSLGHMKEMNILEYDQEGLIWNITSYDSNWAISGSLRYVPVPETNEIYVEKKNAAHQLQYTISYQYEDGIESGLCTQIVQLDDAGGQMIRVENVFDANNIRTHKRIYDQNDSLSFTYDYSYTAWGGIFEIAKKMADGSISRTDIYTYNEFNLPETITITDAENNTIARRLYIYDR